MRFEASLALTRPVRAVLATTRAPIRFGTLVNRLQTEFPEASPEKARQLLMELIRRRVLITGLHAPSTETGALGYLMDQIDAVAQRLITFNPAAHVELEASKRPKALVWTEERILHWKRTGEKPSSVMVWTPEHTGLFLDHVAEDRLCALFHLIAFRGLR